LARYCKKSLPVEAAQFLPDEQRWDKWPDGVQADGEGGHKIRISGILAPIEPGDWRVIEPDGAISLYTNDNFTEFHEET